MIDTYGRDWVRVTVGSGRIRFSYLGFRVEIPVAEEGRIQAILAAIGTDAAAQEQRRPRRIAMSELVDRFTTAEFNAFCGRAQTNNATLSYLIRSLCDERVSLNSNRLEGILDALVAAGSLTAERKAEILA